MNTEERERFMEAYETVFADTKMNEITREFLRNFWELAYNQGRLQGSVEQGEHILELIKMGVN